ncbi:hypothetical protein QAD02_017716 [Eretmocerus hayati]|uniref:Uncharacterized protein n=1 Tax=Eretmocerus hayati TaxID=131215 RepID=A0ACC2PED7_9HYME|nr:hypothetical protein QAD02_017716 [Eretmocerus hayati]
MQNRNHGVRKSLLMVALAFCGFWLAMLVQQGEAQLNFSTGWGKRNRATSISEAASEQQQGLTGTSARVNGAPIDSETDWLDGPQQQLQRLHAAEVYLRAYLRRLSKEVGANLDL